MCNDVEKAAQVYYFAVNNFWYEKMYTRVDEIVQDINEAHSLQKFCIRESSTC